MIGLDEPARFVDFAGCLACGFLCLTLVSLGGFRVLPRLGAWVLFGGTLGLTALTASLWFGAQTRGAIPLIAWTGGLLSLVCSVVAAVAGRVQRGRPAEAVEEIRLITGARALALLFGGAAFTFQFVVVAVRLVYVAADLITVFPGRTGPDLGFGADGLWSLGFLFGSCVVSLAATRGRRLFSCQVIISIMMLVWGSLLWPVLRVSGRGDVEGGGGTLVMALSLALLLAMVVTVGSRFDERWRWSRAIADAPDAGSFPPPWRGLRIACGGLATAVILLVCYHLAVPLATGFSVRATLLIATASAAVAAWATFFLLARSGSSNLSDAAVALTSLAICGLAVSLVPAYPDSLAERYPVIFTAMVIGLAVATWWCAWLATSPRVRQGGGIASLAVRRLIAPARRLAFLNALLALTVAGLMALWPRLRSIAIPDDSLGRVTAGFGGNLFLLLVLLWTSRRLRTLTFHVLTVLALGWSAGFMMIRMYPYTSQFR